MNETSIFFKTETLLYSLFNKMIKMLEVAGNLKLILWQGKRSFSVPLTALESAFLHTTQKHLQRLHNY